MKASNKTNSGNGVKNSLIAGAHKIFKDSTLNIKIVNGQPIYIIETKRELITGSEMNRIGKVAKELGLSWILTARNHGLIIIDFTK